MGQEHEHQTERCAEGHTVGQEQSVRQSVVQKVTLWASLEALC